MSDTSRIDAYAAFGDDYPQQKVVPVNVARELTRECAVHQATIATLQKALTACLLAAKQDHEGMLNAERECVALRAENDGLRRAYVRPDDLRAQLENVQAENANLRRALEDLTP